ncbi:Hypothetical predicted protein [Mytilus galloprovincialis]|uniref:Reverse transcriptase RNase H-like domain-containing protein n=1 Tax=Mytilus galloprovincialis TaxID=29158 RepID=A0A8B6E493_MYTGA|nr:Hypothetical predicted protein [Mytilus galloprovincialis]
MRRTPLGFEKEEEEHLQQLLDKGIIEPSTLEWASPLVLVRKKDGKLRYCIDFRKLNDVTIKDAFPISNIHTCLDTLKEPFSCKRLIWPQDIIRNGQHQGTEKKVESFIGFVNYHRDHIEQFAEIAEPLHRLTGPEFALNEEQTQSFQNLKEALINSVILSYPTPDDLCILDTDASQKSIGAELSQIQDGVERTVSFASKVLTPAQRNYCTTRKELLASICFTRQFRHYLLGRTFVIRTDHNSLTWLLNFKNIEGQLTRWIEELSQCNMILQHRAGKKHINADGLSRIPDDIEACRNYRPDVNLEELPCGGYKCCTRARQQWQIFEEEVDCVVPLTIRRLVDDG